MYEEKKALIVDDEEKARLYLASILSELYPALEIQFASTPAEAIFLLKNQHFDVILLDVEMPGMNGLDMIEELGVRLKNTPFIFVSAYKRADFIQKALRLNAVDYIDKPVNPTELNEAIQRAFALPPDLTFESKTTPNSKRFCLLTDIDERFIETDEILYFEAAKRYSIVNFTDGTKRTVRQNIVHLSTILPTSHFLHVSRQCIVNIKYIKSISKSLKEITLKMNGSYEIKIHKVFPPIIRELSNNYKL
jgi:DNA-binding LytR/AlgR family response regulator